ncbi:hypothetical protein Pla22_28120 [Rubripirellula amarantea]|uniref:Uncharacterized protein n=1 Tax=Rubripirellula amarantea TaxID=2527999 RepID=A0A5C5WX24_9BACT|nr:hypothetical protein Pla22_28120 [Rubripirellula amarantea]
MEQRNTLATTTWQGVGDIIACSIFVDARIVVNDERSARELRIDRYHLGDGHVSRHTRTVYGVDLPTNVV